MLYANRSEAGRALARRLGHCAGHDVLVLALPRGGVPVVRQTTDEEVRDLLRAVQEEPA